MMRTKVVNDSTDLVPLLRAFDNKVKKEVFHELLTDWKPLSEIKQKLSYGCEEKKNYFVTSPIDLLADQVSELVKKEIKR